MKYIGLFFSWLFALIFAVATASFMLMGNVGQGVVLLLATLILLPPVRKLVGGRREKGLSRWGCIGLFVALLGCFAVIGALNKPTSIYKSSQARARFQEIYDAKMEEWPVPHEDIFLDTEYGKVHVIASGDEALPPMLLLHASGVASWSWKFNAKDLSERFRIYAVDLIGDVGKSEFETLDRIMEDGEDQARLYKEISEKLGVSKAVVVGASEGGFIASNYALRHPERVEKLILLGPMGYSGAVSSSLRIMLAQMFPFEAVQDSTFSWAFSDSEVLEEEYGEWFRLLMTSYNPAKVIPLPLSRQQRTSFKVPVLFVFGERDNLVGDPAAAKELVSDIPGVRVEIVEAGHLMGGEIPKKVDEIILEFAGSK